MSVTHIFPSTTETVAGAARRGLQPPTAPSCRPPCRRSAHLHTAPPSTCCLSGAAPSLCLPVPLPHLCLPEAATCHPYEGDVVKETREKRHERGTSSLSHFLEPPGPELFRWDGSPIHFLVREPNKGWKQRMQCSHPDTLLNHKPSRHGRKYEEENIG